MSRSAGGRSLKHGRRSVSDRSLRQGKQGDNRGGNCPGCGSAPIEACRKADVVHDYPLTAVRLGRFFGLLFIAVVEVGRAQVLLGVQAV